jgi:hypothetical protein
MDVAYLPNSNSLAQWIHDYPTSGINNCWCYLGTWCTHRNPYHWHGPPDSSAAMSATSGIHRHAYLVHQKPATHMLFSIEPPLQGATGRMVASLCIGAASLQALLVEGRLHDVANGSGHGKYGVLHPSTTIITSQDTVRVWYPGLDLIRRAGHNLAKVPQ